MSLLAVYLDGAYRCIFESISGVASTNSSSILNLESGLEGRCLQRLGAAVRFRIGDPYDALMLHLLATA